MLKMLKNAFAKENSIKGASLILIVTLALSNILGVIRDHFLAKSIPTDRLDIYFAAFRLPDLIFNVLILGSIAAAFVPVYSRYSKERGKKQAVELAQSAMTIGVTAVISCLVILYFLMPYLMPYLVPNFSVDKKLETIRIARLLLASPLFFTISYFLGGILNSHKRFLAYSIAPLVYNLSIILAVLLFADQMGVQGVAIGVVAGAGLHLMVQFPAALKVGFNFKFRFDYREEGVRKILKLMVPRAVGLGANQVLLVAFTAFASAFPGGIAIYNFADNIQTVPSVIFGSSLATAVFPTLAGLSANVKGEKKRLEELVYKTFRAIIFLLIPSTILLILLRAQIIRIILGYGFFGWSDTKTAAAALGFFALSIVAQGLIPLFARTFYAMHNTKTPMIISVVSIIFSVSLGYIFTIYSSTTVMGIAVLALAFSIGSWINLILLFYFLRRKIKLNLADIFDFTLRVVLLTLFMAVVVQSTKGFIAEMFDIDRVRYLVMQTGLAFVFGAVSYFALAYVMKIEEVRK
jgi:putative peptidoglycan lipid II flippase